MVPQPVLLPGFNARVLAAEEFLQPAPRPPGVPRMTTNLVMPPTADLLDSLTARLARPGPRRSAHALWEEAQRTRHRSLPAPAPVPSLWREALRTARTPFTERVAVAALALLAAGGVAWLALEAAAFAARFEAFAALTRSVLQ